MQAARDFASRNDADGNSPSDSANLLSSIDERKYHAVVGGSAEEAASRTPRGGLPWRFAVVIFAELRPAIEHVIPAVFPLDAAAGPVRLSRGSS
jgi:hypothetical protein